MKKISLNELEGARKNPAAFAKRLKEGTEDSGFRGRPKSVRWWAALNVFHASSDINKASDMLRLSFANRKDTKKNQQEVEDLVTTLHSFTTDLSSRGYFAIDKQITLNIELSPTLRLAGWIWSVYLKSDGSFHGFIITRDVDPESWMSELRYPIVQSFLATTTYGCALENVFVGVVDYRTGRFFERFYPDFSGMGRFSPCLPSSSMTSY